MNKYRSRQVWHRHELATKSHEITQIIIKKSNVSSKASSLELSEDSLANATSSTMNNTFNCYVPNNAFATARTNNFTLNIKIPILSISLLSTTN